MSPGVKKRWRNRLRTVAGVLVTLFCVLYGGTSGDPPAISAGGTYPAGSQPPQVLVGLFRTKSVTFGCGGNWSLTGPQGARVSLKATSTVVLRASGTGISREIRGSGKTTESGPVCISPDSKTGPFISIMEAEGAGASFRFATFRGSMIVMPDGGELLVANVLDMEEYVQSVVGGELPDSWPIESARAQAVAVRSYAAHKTGLKRSSLDRDYVSAFASLKPEDVLIWSQDQVYRGIDEETATTIAATLSTRGQLLTYQGTPAAAYYHSDASGMTEDPSYVWGRGVPYLIAVAEPPHESNHSFWTVTLGMDDLALVANCLDVSLGGPFDSLRGLERGVSGRWFTLSLGAGPHRAPVRGNDLRVVLPQVKSTLFSAWMVGGGRAIEGSLSTGMSFSVAGSSGIRDGVHLGSSYIMGAGGEPVPPPEAVSVLSGAAIEGPPEVVLQGSGWGHGVGLSQWGARGMALDGHDAREILNLYYPLTTLEQWW